MAAVLGIATHASTKAAPGEVCIDNHLYPALSRRDAPSCSELVYRGFTALSLFVRPALGAVQQTATPRPRDAIAAAIVQQLTPSGSKTDWQCFYGFGGGATINMTQHTTMSVQVDVVRDHLFNDILKDGRWTVRLAVGPNIQWGRNMMK